MSAMSEVVGSVVIVGGVGLCFAVLIAAAYRKLYVWEDPRVEAVTAMLPGSNCGACGLPGCLGFAQQAVAGEVQPSGCNVLNDEGAMAIAAFLGVEAGAINKKAARLLCAGGTNVAVQQADYRGLETCAAAATVAAGGKGCTWGCLGFGDCAVVCDFDAIRMNEFGLPVVDIPKCTACGDCVDACPKDLFTIMPLDQRLIVQCRSLIEGDGALDACAVACTACGKCVVDAAPGLIHMERGLAVIDYSKNALATVDATRRCPTAAIVWVDGAQFSDQRLALPAAAVRMSA
jgi:Na+-translocating ferredoxin:NAD+ oxidoreductase RNF subunit RnfB